MDITTLKEPTQFSIIADGVDPRFFDLAVKGIKAIVGGHQFTLVARLHGRGSLQTSRMDFECPSLGVQGHCKQRYTFTGNAVEPGELEVRADIMPDALGVQTQMLVITLKERFMLRPQFQPPEGVTTTPVSDLALAQPR
jgi:hypothetical protein